MVGSVKSNLGHAEEAASLVGIVKAIIVLRTGLIPPTINYAPPDVTLPVKVNPGSRVRGKGPRMAKGAR